jgi:hypothetical protein
VTAAASGAPSPAAPRAIAHPIEPAVIGPADGIAGAPERSTSPAAEVVRVTIGRIEVRATVATPPAARPITGAPAATLSLADYLAGRREAR